jgi:hypothetical protein
MSFTQRKNIWRVTSGELQAEIDVRAGGRIRALRSQKSKRNFLFTHPAHKTKSKAQSVSEISGWKECFPTVKKSLGRFGQALGVLWNVPWEAYQQGKQLITRIARPHGMPVIVTRVITANRTNCIRFDYTVVNLSKNAQPFVYSSYPIFKVDAQSRIRLLGVKQLTVAENNGSFKTGTVQTWPVATLKNGDKCRLDTQLSSERKLSGRWFAKNCHGASITFPRSKERLVLRWDQEHLPFLGLWLSLGLPLDPKFEDPKLWKCVALTPGNSVSDSVQSRKTPELKPGEAFSFWLEWRLDSKREMHKRIQRRLFLKRIRRMLPRRK